MRKNSIILLILLILIVLSNSTKTTKKKNKHKVKKIHKEPLDNITNIIPTVLDWAKNNDIYINSKLTLNKRTSHDNYYSFYADSKILNNTLLFKVPYNMMLTQKNLYEMYNSTKNNKFSNLWENILKIKSDYVKYYSIQQLLYLSIFKDKFL